MEKNCLVKKLKVSIDNNNLPVLGQLLVEFTNNANTTKGYFKSAADNTITLISGNNPVYNRETPEAPYELPNTVPANTLFGVSIMAGINGVVAFSNKYKIVQLDGFFDNAKNFNVDEFKYNDSLEVFSCQNTSCYGNISSFNGKPLISLNISNTHITGDINEIASLTSLTTLGIKSTTKITGTLEGFAAAMVAAGRKSGTLVVAMHNAGVTFGGQIISENISKTITFTGSGIGYTIA